MADDTVLVEAAHLEDIVIKAFRDIGVSEASLQAAVKAMMHASLAGVDSHGVRLTPHYITMLEAGRLNKNPQLQVRKTAAGAAMVDGDNGLGHYAAYKAVEVACGLAAEAGMAGVGVNQSSHFGAAGAFALAAAERGMIGFATTNSDALAPLFGGAGKFHGTNPLAFAAPVEGGKPWFFDMATTSVPLNRVLLHRSLGKTLPEGVAADAEGVPTTDPDAAEMVLPLGGADYGYKGAGLAGVATVLSAVLNGGRMDFDMIPMVGPGDAKTPRNMGHFVFAIDPGFFGAGDGFSQVMARYVASLRGAPVRDGAELLAPGDREWRVVEQRRREGIPIDPDTAAFLRLA